MQTQVSALIMKALDDLSDNFECILDKKIILEKKL